MTDGMDEIRKQVLERVDQEAVQINRQSDAAPKITSSFIQDCLTKNELGDGTLFAALFRDQFLYCKNTQEWFEWTGHFWQRDVMNRSLAAVEKLSEHYLAEYKAIGEKIIELTASDDDDDRSEKMRKLKSIQVSLIKRVSQLRGDKRRSACLKFAHTIEEPLAIKGEEFDMHPMLFPCANGVIDLETGRIRPGCPGDYLSLASPVEFLDIDTPAPLWEKSLLEIFNGNTELVAYLQRLFGYAMTGVVKEKVFPVLYGKTGWNGRSLIVEAISHIMGDLAAAIQSEMLLSQKFAKSSSAPSPDVMALKGVRLAFASEIDEGQRFSASKIKWLTGNDSLVGRGLQEKHPQKFPPTHKLMLMTNTQPAAPAKDTAFWERMHLIPFEISFVNRDPLEPHERRANLDLARQVLKEAPGILAWLVRGCLLWQQHGLKPPLAVTEASEKYQKNEDMMGDFIDECCLREPAAKVQAAEIFKRFEDWYHENIGKGDKLTGTWFGKQFSHYFEKTKINGRNFYLGVDVKPQSGESETV